MPERVDNHGIMEEPHLQFSNMQAWLAGPNSAGPAARFLDNLRRGGETNMMDSDLQVQSQENGRSNTRKASAGVDAMQRICS